MAYAKIGSQRPGFTAKALNKIMQSDNQCSPELTNLGLEYHRIVLLPFNGIAAPQQMATHNQPTSRGGLAIRRTTLVFAMLKKEICSLGCLTIGSLNPTDRPFITLASGWPSCERKEGITTRGMRTMPDVPDIANPGNVRPLSQNGNPNMATNLGSRENRIWVRAKKQLLTLSAN